MVVTHRHLTGNGCHSPCPKRHHPLQQPTATQPRQCSGITGPAPGGAAQRRAQAALQGAQIHPGGFLKAAPHPHRHLSLGNTPRRWPGREVTGTRTQIAAGRHNQPPAPYAPEPPSHPAEPCTAPGLEQRLVMSSDQKLKSLQQYHQLSDGQKELRAKR